MVKQLHILFVLFVFPCGFANADERDRTARVALALAATAKPATTKACPCGDACDCSAGKCPACPAAAKAKPTVAYREVWYSDGRRVWRQLEPVAGGDACPNGRCPLPR